MEPSCSSAADYDATLCVLCQNSELAERLLVVKSGIDTLIKFSREWKDDSLRTYLSQQNITDKPVLTHESCRRNYVNKRRVEAFQKSSRKCTPSVVTRAYVDFFDWKHHCFYCGLEAKEDKKHPGRKRGEIHYAKTLPFRENLLALCDRKLKKRDNDWAARVKHRLLNCSDFVQAEARYHHRCHGKFSSSEELSSPLNKNLVGRQVNSKSMQYFDQLCDYIECQAEVYSLRELHEKMLELAGSEDEEMVYSVKWLKIKLLQKYGDHVQFCEQDGKCNVVCFRDMANYIINEKWYREKKTDVEVEAERIIIAAAKLIKAQIRETSFNIKEYPSLDDIENNHATNIPSNLRVFMETLISSQLHQSSIGQCILKATRPRSVIPPLLFGLGVELDHVFGSKWLINELFKLGFCVSYSEITRYKQAVVSGQSLENLLADYFPGSFTQWVADNVDHNIRTLNGQKTFHGMGMIAVSNTTEEHSTMVGKKVIRPHRLLKAKEVVANKGIPIVWYDSSELSGMRSIKFKPIEELLHVPCTLPSSLSIDVLWHSAGLFKNLHRPRPNWSAFMQSVSKGKHPPKSNVTMLPIIDLDPSNYSCLYSVLLYIIDQSKALDVSTPCITFDQPLWFKAMEIITAKSLPVVCRLGGFHTLMSFLGSIGSLMAGSGLNKALETTYGKNAIEHMMTGKAISRAIRGHFLADAALHINLLQELLPEDADVLLETATLESEAEETYNSSDCESDRSSITTPCTKRNTESVLTPNQYDEIKSIYTGVVNGEVAIENVGDNSTLVTLKDMLELYKKKVCSESRTAKLWLLYCEYVDVVKLFIRAERTSNWELHLYATGKMLNLFAATGHIHYAKSARLYLQIMLDLPRTHPWLYEQFYVKGLFSVRRSDRFWAGLWTDLTIEQVLMRSIKSRGGLTRGRGMTEEVRLLWIYSMHECASVHNKMTDITGFAHRTSEQHIEIGKSRCERDLKDLEKIRGWFQQNNPFNGKQANLVSLSTGYTVVADEVNCDTAEEIGYNIQKGLNNVTVHAASIKRSQQVRSLLSLEKGVMIENQVVHIDPIILFTRLTVLLERNDKMADYFKYELTPIPTSLFKDSMMRKPNKSTLASYLTSSRDNVMSAGKRKRKIQEVNSGSDNQVAKRSCPGTVLQEILNDDEAENTIRNENTVIDGGALLHRVSWQPKVTYREVIAQYQCYVTTKYGKSTIVFDGYGNGPAIKDHEHERRSKGVKRCADIKINENMEAHGAQHLFLSNDLNKTKFIDLLSRYLTEDGHKVVRSEDDADTLIVSSAIDFAISGNVIVVADDTDILIMLLYFWNSEMAKITLKQKKKDPMGEDKMVDIGKLASILDRKILNNLLFIHAWAGCDTTSAIHGKGKTSIIKAVLQSEYIEEACRVFKDEDATNEQIAEAGCLIFVALYGGKSNDTLSNLRYASFMKMAATANKLQPEKLPPSERAAVHHSWRVHLQVLQWQTLIATIVNPTAWGWKLVSNKYVPIMTDEAPAPDEILKIIRCNCKTSSRNTCASSACTCRRNGLKCVTACGDCRGFGCHNSTEEMTIDDDLAYDDDVEGGIEEDGNIFEQLFDE